MLVVFTGRKPIWDHVPVTALQSDFGWGFLCKLEKGSPMIISKQHTLEVFPFSALDADDADKQMYENPIIQCQHQ
ncbi:hypothetical protein F2P81_014021 [Scophthalmus maximus]|uniref:Uncharacterized protein n=1 Tax=Scophthalmus maximus TaxID=52904 RepID=A0A6A4SN06_SCOMX|nr:hypothetical protein F2P81_014021 [Scophthalmus maximus]